MVNPPPDAVTVIAVVASAAFGPTVKVSVLVPVPGRGRDAGVKVAVTPAGRPLTESATAAPGLPEIVTPIEPDAPVGRLPAEALRARISVLDCGAEMVTVREVEAATVPPEPFTVME